MLVGLLPPGRAWKPGTNSLLAKLLLACGDELERLGVRAVQLIQESDPRQATETLPEWERMLELGSDGTTEQRRARVVALIARRQRFRPGDFQTALAALLGQLPEDVVVIETTRAMAVAMQTDREIFRFYIYRNPALGGTYSVADAQAVVNKMKPSHTQGHIIESNDFLCDDPFSLCDRDRLGA